VIGCSTFGFETRIYIRARPQALLVESVRYRAGFTATTSRVVQAPFGVRQSPCSRELSQFLLQQGSSDSRRTAALHSVYQLTLEAHDTVTPAASEERIPLQLSAVI